MSGYQEAMEAAGASVLAFESFGSYQGDWYAKVVYKGRTSFVTGSYGSCSGCDAFEAEFGYGESKCTEHEYTYDEEVTSKCDDCKTARDSYQSRLAAFGEGYLDDVMSYEEARARASKNAEWDMEADEMVKWLDANQ